MQTDGLASNLHKKFTVEARLTMSETQGKYSKMAGNQNALKYNTPTDATVSLRCHSKDHERWREIASREGKSFNQWAVQTLNAAQAQASTAKEERNVITEL